MDDNKGELDRRVRPGRVPAGRAGGVTMTGRGLSPDEVTTWDCLICGLRWQGTYRDFCPNGHHLATPARTLTDNANG